MKKIALITALLLTSTSASAGSNWFAPLIVGGIGGYLIGRPQTIQQQQPVVVQNQPPIIIQQNPGVRNTTPIYQWMNISDENCGCIRRVLVQIN